MEKGLGANTLQFPFNWYVKDESYSCELLKPQNQGGFLCQLENKSKVEPLIPPPHRQTQVYTPEGGLNRNNVWGMGGAKGGEGFKTKNKMGKLDNPVVEKSED